MSKRFTTQLDEDDFGDLVLTIPYDICQELGWDTESILQYDVNDDGFHLKEQREPQ